jgi:hypothetical protein
VYGAVGAGARASVLLEDWTTSAVAWTGNSVVVAGLVSPG